MSERHADKPGIKWVYGDVRDMPVIPDTSVDVAVDKGTLDAMVSGSPWDPPEHVKENIRRYVDEVCMTFVVRDTCLTDIRRRSPASSNPAAPFSTLLFGNLIL